MKDYHFPLLTVNASRASRRLLFPSVSQWWGAELQWVSTTLALHKLAWGLDYRRDTHIAQFNADQAPTATYLDTRRKGQVLAAYLQDEWALRPDLALHTGLRYDHHAGQGGSIHPRLGLVHWASPSTTVKLLHGTAYRPPNAYEQDYRLDQPGGVVDSGVPLRPERVRTTELAIEHVPTIATRMLLTAFHSEVHNLIETAIGGKEVSKLYEGERRFGIAVRFPEGARNSVENIRNTLLRAPDGALVPLYSVATIELRDGPAQISRESAKRRVVVGANVEGRDLGSFVEEVERRIAAEIQLPEGFYFVFGGQFENMERAMSTLAVIVPITIAAIFFLLFMLFKSIKLATLIILVLPFASIGGVIGLAVTGEYLSVPASVGFIALWGIAVLNGVVLVTSIRRLREDGLDVLKAVREGCVQRFRPVMMTATVALLGLVPFLFATGPGSEVQKPLAVVVIGGLISSTLLTLVVLPALYRWFDDHNHEA